MLGAVALLLGALTPMLASASDYDELGTVDEGVYAVASEDETLRVQADEPLGLLVRSADGAVVDARELAADEERTFLLDGEEAIVAVQGGEATIEAKGEGSVEPLSTARERVTLAEANETNLERALTVQVPEGALLAHAVLDGDADALTVEIASDEETVLAADEAALATPAALHPAAVEADALDVEVQADSLEGAVELAFLVLPDEQTAASTATGEETDERRNATVVAHKLEYSPISFTVPEVEDTGRLVVEIDSGYVFDASVYNADGAQVEHVHAGPSLAEQRTECRGFLDCPRGGSYPELAPQTIERELPAGEHLLFVREAAVDGTLTLEGPEGDPLLPDAEPGEVTTVDVHQDRELQVDRPLLDVWRTYEHDSGEVQPRVDVEAANATAMSYRAGAEAAGHTVGEELELAPDAMEAGPVVVRVGNAVGDPVGDRLGAMLVLPAT